MHELSIIVAYDQKRGIGKDGKLPWHLPADLARFKALTMGKAVIMGRKTYQSLPGPHRPLNGRLNVVITSNPRWKREGVLTAKSLAGAMALVGHSHDMVAIGGQQVFEEALPLADMLYLTEVKGDFGCDRFFPEINDHDWGVCMYQPLRGNMSGIEARTIDLARIQPALAYVPDDMPARVRPRQRDAIRFSPSLRKG